MTSALTVFKLRLVYGVKGTFHVCFRFIWVVNRTINQFRIGGLIECLQNW